MKARTTRVSNSKPSPIVVPTWAVWIFTALAVVNIVQHIWKIVLLKRQARHEPPNARLTGRP